MKITQTAQKIKLNQVMDISVDVHKDTLNFLFEAEGKEYRMYAVTGPRHLSGDSMRIMTLRKSMG